MRPRFEKEAQDNSEMASQFKDKITSVSQATQTFGAYVPQLPTQFM